MGFFTDSDKKYESQAPANLDENEGNLFEKEIM